MIADHFSFWTASTLQIPLVLWTATPSLHETLPHLSTYYCSPNWRVAKDCHYSKIPILLILLAHLRRFFTNSEYYYSNPVRQVVPKGYFLRMLLKVGITFLWTALLEFCVCLRRRVSLEGWYIILSTLYPSNFQIAIFRLNNFEMKKTFVRNVV